MLRRSNILLQKQKIGNNSFGIQVKGSLNITINPSKLDESDLNSLTDKLVSKFMNKCALYPIKITSNYDDSNIILDLPPLPEKLSKRNKVIRNLVKILDSYNWLALYGEIGIGKTTLALLLNKQFNGSYFWIPFRGIKKEGLSQYFHKVFYAHFNQEIPIQNLENFFHSLFSQVHNGSIILFDDLPNLSEDTTLFKILIIFGKVAQENNVKIISTSSNSFSESFISSVGRRNLKLIKK